MAEKEQKQEELQQEESTKTEEQTLKDTILMQKQKLEEQEDRLKRLMAEFDNYKKRSSKERENLYNSILGDVIEVILPILDNLENASKAETKDESYKQGIELVLKQFKDVLESKGVKEIKAIRRNF